jgi:hypothetical protein
LLRSGSSLGFSDVWIRQQTEEVVQLFFGFSFEFGIKFGLELLD